MRLLNTNEVAITKEELQDLCDFIDGSLERDWDRHTDNFICEDPIEVGKSRMNPVMYAMCQKMQELVNTGSALEEFLKIADVPEGRRDLTDKSNVKWLKFNMWIRNGSLPGFQEADVELHKMFNSLFTN